MDKKWVEKMISEERTRRKEIAQKIEAAVKEAHNIEPTQKAEILKNLEEHKYSLVELMIRMSLVSFYAKQAIKDHASADPFAIKTAFNYFNSLGLMRLAGCDDEHSEYIKSLEDSEPKYFSGDIIITDPLYVVKDDTNQDDWKKCEYGYSMEKLGFKNFMMRNTIYGDWSCTTFDSDTKEEIGSFCADTGEVGVFLLDEVLKYNPDFNYHIEKTWTTTLIKDFEGTIQFTVTEEPYEYKGKRKVEYVVRVIGHGKNKVTGGPIIFITEQTGF